MKDHSLGDRMKRQYENRTRILLPRRTYTIIRVDGKAFHTYTRGCDKPFDQSLIEHMNEAAVMLCKEISGARFAYTQSDEISVLLTDFETDTSEAWFDGNLQKLTSISASIATATLNRLRPEQPPAYFDGRAFTIPDHVEVYNYFVWRQQDASRNSIFMIAQCHYSQERLNGLSPNEIQELLWQEHKINWNDYAPGHKRGRTIVPRQTENGKTEWRVEEPPVFTKEPEYLNSLIPRIRPN